MPASDHKARHRLLLPAGFLAVSLLLHSLGLVAINSGFYSQTRHKVEDLAILQAQLLSLPEATPAAPMPPPGKALRAASPPVRPAAAVPAVPAVPSSSSATSLPEQTPPQTLPAEPVAPPEPPPATQTANQAAQDAAAVNPPVAAGPQPALLGSATLTYGVGYGSAEAPVRQGINTVRWQFADGKYEIESVSEATGLAGLLVRGQITETSAGDVTPEGLAPLRYGDKRAGRGERAAHFQRDKSVLSFSNRSDTVALPAGVQDRLSLRFQLGLLLQGAPHLQAIGSVIAVPVAGPNGLDIWNIVVQSRDVVHTAAGDFPVLHLAREKRADRPYDQTVEIWLTPSLSWLPVRVRIQDANGRALDAILEKVDAQ